MAEVALLVGLADGAIGIVMKCAQAIKALHDLRGCYKVADLAFRSLIEQLETIEFAWDKIHKWSITYQQSPIYDDDDLDLFHQVDRKLECGYLVISALSEDLDKMNAAKHSTRLKRRQRTKFLWNEASIEAHRSRMRDQVSTMTLLLQIIKLPTVEQRSQHIAKSAHRLAKSDESALSIVPSAWSFTSRHGRRQSTDAVDLTYVPFDFEDALFTAKVYKRNYRAPQHVAKVGEGETETIERGTIAPTIDECEQGVEDVRAKLTLFERACENGDMNYIRYGLRMISLLRNNEVFEATKGSFLRVAAKHSQFAVMELLLESGWAEHLNEGVSDKPTALSYALQDPDKSMEELLLAHGANITGTKFIIDSSAAISEPPKLMIGNDEPLFRLGSNITAENFSIDRSSGLPDDSQVSNSEKSSSFLSVPFNPAFSSSVRSLSASVSRYKPTNYANGHYFGKEGALSSERRQTQLRKKIMKETRIKDGSENLLEALIATNTKPSKDQRLRVENEIYASKRKLTALKNQLHEEIVKNPKRPVALDSEELFGLSRYSPLKSPEIDVNALKKQITN